MNNFNKLITFFVIPGNKLNNVFHREFFQLLKVSQRRSKFNIWNWAKVYVCVRPKILYTEEKILGEYLKSHRDRGILSKRDFAGFKALKAY